MLIILIADVDVNASCDAKGRSTIDGDCAAMVLFRIIYSFYSISLG